MTPRTLARNHSEQEQQAALQEQERAAAQTIQNFWRKAREQQNSRTMESTGTTGGTMMEKRRALLEQREAAELCILNKWPGSWKAGEQQRKALGQVDQAASVPEQNARSGQQLLAPSWRPSELGIEKGHHQEGGAVSKLEIPLETRKEDAGVKKEGEQQSSTTPKKYPPSSPMSTTTGTTCRSLGSSSTTTSFSVEENWSSDCSPAVVMIPSLGPFFLDELVFALQQQPATSPCQKFTGPATSPCGVSSMTKYLQQQTTPQAKENEDALCHPETAGGRATTASQEHAEAALFSGMELPLLPFL